MPTMPRTGRFFHPFLSVCPRKKEIWNRMLNQQFPTYEIRAEDITSMLTNLQSPFHDRSALYTPFTIVLHYTLLSRSFCTIHSFHDIGIYDSMVHMYILLETHDQSEIIISKINSQITILLNKRQLD
jgi:hypothetical protein